MGNERFCRNNLSKICVGLKVRYFNKNSLRQSLLQPKTFYGSTEEFILQDSNDLLVQKKIQEPIEFNNKIFDERTLGFNPI